MKLAKALKTKNRLASKISHLMNDVRTNNSLPNESKKEVNVSELMEEIRQLTNQLIQLKIKIFVASAPIREHILRISELKSETAFLKSISTVRGKIMERTYGGAQMIEYEASITKEEVTKRINECEEEIDKLQEEIDEHNYTTEIE